MTAPPGDRREGDGLPSSGLRIPMPPVKPPRSESGFVASCGCVSFYEAGRLREKRWCDAHAPDPSEPESARARREGAAEALEQAEQAAVDRSEAALTGEGVVWWTSVAHWIAALRSALAAGQEETG